MKTLRLLPVVFLISFGVAAAQAQQPSPQAEELLQTAETLYQQGNYEEAFNTCARAIGFNSKDYRAHALMGRIHMARQKLKEASESFASAIKLAPGEKELYIYKAQIDFFRNSRTEALAAAKQAIAVDPKYAEAHYLVGMYLKNDVKRQAEAIAALRTAIEIDPQFVAAYAELGFIHNLANQQIGRASCRERV